MQVQDAGQHLGGQFAVLPVVAEAGHGTGLVVVAPVEAVPAAPGQGFLPAAKGLFQVSEPQLPGPPLVAVFLVQRHVLELEHHVHLAPGRVCEQDGVLHRDAGHLAHGQQRLIPAGENFEVHFVQELVDPGSGHEVRAAVAEQHAVSLWPVRQGGVLGDEVDDVHPEAVHAAVQPPVHHVVDGGADLRVFPVQVRLLPGEQV
ncbi:hypothetical protein D9M72_527380 [compost metagenome]